MYKIEEDEGDGSGDVDGDGWVEIGGFPDEVITLGPEPEVVDEGPYGPSGGKGGRGDRGGWGEGSGSSSGVSGTPGQSSGFTPGASGGNPRVPEVSSSGSDRRTSAGSSRLADPINFNSPDFIFSEFVSDSLGSETFIDTGDWCGSSPDDFVPELFPESCFNHDKNYSDLSLTKGEADIKFLFDMFQERPDRVRVAVGYYGAVRMLGGGPYKAAQEFSRSSQARRTRAYGRGGKGPLRDQ